MSLESAEGENGIELRDDEKRLIEDNIDHLDTIVVSILGNLDELDWFKRQVGIYNADTDTPTGIHLGYSIHGEYEIPTDPRYNEFEQLYKLVFGNEFVKIHLNRDNTIKKIITNMPTDKPYTVIRWLNRAYETFDMILNADQDFYLEWERFSF